MGIYDPILQANQHGLDQNFALQQQRLQMPTMADVFMERLQQGQKMALQRQQLQALMGYRNAMIDERQGFHQGMIQNGMDRNQNAADRNDIISDNYDQNNAYKQALLDPRIQKLLADAGYKQAQTAEVAPNAQSKRDLQGAETALAGARTESEPIKAGAAQTSANAKMLWAQKWAPSGALSVSDGSGNTTLSDKVIQALEKAYEAEPEVASNRKGIAEYQKRLSTYGADNMKKLGLQPPAPLGDDQEAAIRQRVLDRFMNFGSNTKANPMNPPAKPPVKPSVQPTGPKRDVQGEQDAQAAIASGKDPAAVKQRFKQLHGYDLPNA